MFKIIGADGKEYGPVSELQIRHWIAAGRASLETQAQAAGDTGWRPLREFSEFSEPPPLQAATASSTGPAGSMPSSLAGRGVRTGAAFVNALIYCLAIMPGSVAMSRTLTKNNPELQSGRLPRIDELDLTGLEAPMTWFWAGLGVALLVQAVLLAWRGQNLGKLLLGLRVVRANTGEPAGFMRATVLRFLLPVTFMILLYVTTVVFGLAFLMLDYCFIFRADRRCLHDLIAGTVVVRR